MPYEIRELLNGLPTPATANPDESLHEALTCMLEHDYSQLAVVKGSGQSAQFYLLTYQKILETMKLFGLPTTGKGLKVERALVKVPRVFTPNDTIAEVMEGLKTMDAVLIVDEQRNLQNIVTIYDTTQFFRQWSEDILNAREVEMVLRRIITGAFKRSDGTIDEVARQRAIDGTASDEGGEVTGKTGYKRFADALTLYLEQQSTAGVKLERKLAWEAFGKFLDENRGTATSIGEASGSALPVSVDSAADRALPSASPVNNGGQRLSTAKEQRRQFEAALEYYLKQSNVQPNPNSDWLKSAFQKYYQVRQEPRHFNKLSMGEYIDLFFRECWGRCGEVFDFDRDVVDRVLSSVRQIRNLLAHFREEEITDEHRRNLRLAAEWLPQYERAALAKLDETAPLVPDAETAITVLSTGDTLTL